MKYIIPSRSSVVHVFYGKARKLHARREVHGMQISVENAQGTSRHWYDPHAKESGSTRMLYDYGYIRGTEGTDGDHVDVYVGPNPESENVYVITQMKKPAFTAIDEQKVMLGFSSAKKAKRAYLAHYNDPRFFGSMKKMNIETFKEKVFAKENHGELVRSGMLTLADLVKAARPPGSGWTSIPGGHKGGFRKRRGDGYDYWYPDQDTPQAHRVEHEEKKWKTTTKFSEEDFRSGDFDKDATHWQWKKTDGDLKAWTAGGVNPSSQHPVKVGGRFAKLLQIYTAEDSAHPGFAVLKDVTTGERMMMQHTKIFPVEHNPTGRAVVAKPKGAVAPPAPPKTPPSRPQAPVRTMTPAKRAPVFETSTASKERQPGLYAIENGLYPMAAVERWETNEDGAKKKIKLEMIGVPDHGKNLLVKEFEPLIASTAKSIAKKYALQSQYERRGPNARAVNLTLAELQRAGIEGVLDAIERYDAKSAFAPHAKQFVVDHVRLAAARERLGGVTLPPRHQRNVGRYIAARAQAAKSIGVEDPSPEQVAPFFKLLKRHLHSHLTGTQANEAVPATGYKIVTAHEGAEGAVKRTGERVGEQEPHVERDTVTHPGKLEWAHLYDSFLKGQASGGELFDEDKFALPGMGMGLGYSPEERVAIRQSVQRSLDSLSEFEFTASGRKKTKYKGDAGEMLALRLGLYGDDEMSVAQIAAKVPVYSGGKALARRQAEGVIAEMLEHAIEHAREATIGRDAKKLMERAEEKLVAPVEVPHGPTWHEVVRKRAESVTPQQIAAYREEEKGRLQGLVTRSQERAEQARGERDKALNENAVRGAEEAMRRVERMDEGEIRMKLAQRLAPETAEMRRLMTQSVSVDMPAPRGMEYGHQTMTLTDLASGEQRNVMVRTLRDLRDPEDKEMEKSERKAADAKLSSGMLREAIYYPRVMRLLVAPDAQLASAPTISRRTVELLSGLGDVR